MPQIYKVFINNRCFEIMPDAGAQANIPGTLVVNYDSAETLSLLIDLAHSEAVFFKKVIILHNDPSRVLAKIEHLSKVVNAAGGAVFNSEHKLLMIFRNGKWDLPKGKMEKGETPEQSAVREVEEECGISNLNIVRELPSTYNTYKINDRLHLKRTWWYEMRSDDNRKLIPQTEEGITKAEWLDETGVAAAKKNTYGSIEDVLNNLN
jgi:8-oxo-dGTP pyrophosphatase MutT (NUDIX family)